MGKLNIRATLSDRSRGNVFAPKLPYIMRGASCELYYNLADRCYDFSIIDQLTFIFKQGKTIWAFKMLNYFVSTTDDEVILDKKYFTNLVVDAETNQCTADLVINPTGSPAGNGWYEIVENDEVEKDNTPWNFEPHFIDPRNMENYCITFILSPEDTLRFKETVPGREVKVETVVRLDTEQLALSGKMDSHIIEPQLPMIVFNSLYGELNGLNGPDTAGITQDRVVSVDKVARE